MLKFCPECGARLPEGFKFCGQCGTQISAFEIEQEAARQHDTAPVPNVEQPQTAPKHVIKIDKYQLRVEETVIAYNELRTKFVNYAEHCASAFEAYYTDHVKDFEGLYDKALPKAFEHAASAIVFATSTLQDYGLPTLKEEDFLLYAEDSIHLDRDLREYADISDAILELTEQLSSYRAAQRSQSSRWQGGGFGLKGAISGALMAGALNLGTQAVRGVGNAIVDSADRTRLKKVCAEIYESRDHKQFISEKLYNYCVDLFEPAGRLLEDTGLLLPPPFDIGAGIGPMSEAFDLVNGKQEISRANCERAIELTLQGMPCNPYFLLSYLTLYQVPLIQNKEIVKLARFFGVEREFSAKVREYEAQTITMEFDPLPARTLEEIDAKLAKAQKLNEEFLYTKISLSKLRQAKNKMLREEKAAKEERGY